MLWQPGDAVAGDTGVELDNHMLCQVQPTHMSHGALCYMPAVKVFTSAAVDRTAAAAAVVGVSARQCVQTKSHHCLMTLTYTVQLPFKQAHSILLQQ